jgi:hypothetical protein
VPSVGPPQQVAALVRGESEIVALEQSARLGVLNDNEPTEFVRRADADEALDASLFADVLVRAIAEKGYDTTQKEVAHSLATWLQRHLPPETELSVETVGTPVVEP